MDCRILINNIKQFVKNNIYTSFTKIFIIMNLLISGELTAPPSEVSAFRSLTLYATVFKHLDCLVEVPREEIDFYHRWLKDKYAYDFVKEIVYIGETSGFRLQHSRIKKLTYNNLNDLIFVVSMIK